jgi:hypothetical protein
MKTSIVLYTFDGVLEGPELIHAANERALITVIELHIEICELNGLGLIPLSPVRIDGYEYFVYISLTDEHQFYIHLDKILGYIAADFHLPRTALKMDEKHIIPLTA